MVFGHWAAPFVVHLLDMSKILHTVVPLFVYHEALLTVQYILIISLQISAMFSFRFFIFCPLSFSSITLSTIPFLPSRPVPIYPSEITLIQSSIKVCGIIQGLVKGEWVPPGAHMIQLLLPFRLNKDKGQSREMLVTQKCALHYQSEDALISKFEEKLKMHKVLLSVCNTNSACFTGSWKTWKSCGILKDHFSRLEKVMECSFSLSCGKIQAFFILS